ncbi:MAG: hypothetical protein OXG50_13305, partial [bacterium]|nr:hypothetical protein [bacterium]
MVLAVAVGSGVLPVVPGPLDAERAEAQTAQDASLLFSPHTLSSTQFEKTDSGYSKKLGVRIFTPSTVRMRAGGNLRFGGPGGGSSGNRCGFESHTPDGQNVAVLRATPGALGTGTTHCN